MDGRSSVNASHSNYFIFVLLIPFIAVIRGYYQGLYNMFPTALSQIAEQIVRVGTILCLSIFFIHHGYGPYTAGAGAIFGSITGGITSLIILCLFVLEQRQILREYFNA